MALAKYKRGWYVTNTANGIKGKIVDVFMTPRGIEYTILVGSLRLTFSEAQLIREGSQGTKFNFNKKGGHL